MTHCPAGNTGGRAEDEKATGAREPGRPGVPTITILHTNDLHGRLDAAAADRLLKLRARHPGALLLDAGDAISAGNLGVRAGGEPILTLMNDLGYHAMTLGNRETHPLRHLFPRKIDRARFPLLCANVTARSGAPMPLRPHVVLETGAARVGVFGITVPMFTRRQWSQFLCDYLFTPPLEAAAAAFAAVRLEADLVVALTHIGFRQDLELAARLPDLALIIGGHSHTDLDAPAWVGPVPVVQARSHGFYAGVARLEWSDRGTECVHWERAPLRSDSPRPKQPAGGAA